MLAYVTRLVETSDVKYAVMSIARHDVGFATRLGNQPWVFRPFTQSLLSSDLRAIADELDRLNREKGGE